MSATILVLEDDLVLRELLCEVLLDEGHQVVAAEALPVLLQNAPPHADLLITDMLFNDHLGGLHAIERVRAAVHTNLPVMICSAAQTELDKHKDEIKRLDAQVLPKPFTIDELLNHVDTLLHRGYVNSNSHAALPHAFA